MKKLSLLGLLLSITLLLSAQSFNLSEKIPFDIHTTKGVLKNGLTYYVKSNSTPKNRAELMLVVSAGSVLEDADQLGLAHFCEHMNFNGTKNFPKNDLIKYFESIGMEFGPEINAYTNFDETVYMIKIPLDKEEYLQKGLQVLYDWAAQVTDSDEEIEKERGVVHEEWRGGQGAEKRMLNQWLPVFLKDSKYAQRLPIGDPKIIDNCKPEVLRRFRKDWYRPDLQAIIAVGDFDKTKIINLIKEKFSAIPVPVNPRKKEISPIPRYPETLVKIVTDKEATYSGATVYIKQPMELDLTIKGYRTTMVNSLYNQMINLRLSELAQKENPPFVMGQAEYGSLIGPSDVYYSTAITHPGKIQVGLKAVLLENERVKKFGFNQSELDRTKSAAMKYMETAFNNKDKRESMSLAQEFTRNFLMRQEPTPGIEVEYQYYKQFMPTITLEEINASAKKWLNAENRVVVVTAPELAANPAPTEAEIRSVLVEAEGQKIEQYADVTSSEPLMKAIPIPGKVILEKKITSVDATEWTLSNGAKVVYKKTDFKDDEILFTAYSLGGWSLYGQSDNMSASIAATIMDLSGLADYNSTTLRKMLAGKVVNVTPMLKMLTQGLEGSSNVSDLETCLQAINLYFTKPRFDESAFSSYITKMHSQLDNNTVSPERAFADTFKWTTSGHHPRMKPLTKDMLDEAKFSRITQIAKERYANPGAFTFIFVGKIDPVKFKPLVEKYIASLTNGQKAEKWVDLGVHKPNGVVEKIVYKGKEPKSIQYIQFHGKLNYASKELMEIDALGKILTTRLLESIREDKSSVYYIGAQPGMVKFPHPEFEMNIYYGTAPEKVKDLKTSVFAIIKDLVVNGPKQEEVDKAREKIKRERETNLRENNYWSTTLKSYYLNMNGDFKSFDEFTGAVQALNVQSLKSAAVRTFDFKNFTSVALMPEKSEAVK
jgi:zinc protease